jgi:protein-disulfide isomerase
MNDATRDNPGGDRPAAPAPAAVAPRPATSAPPPPPRNTLTMVLPAICLVAVGVMWLRLDGQIAQLREGQRRLAADVSALKQTETIDVTGAPALGPEGATVTLVEFSDYECPFCVRHFKQTMPQIEANFIRSGRIRYYFRDFPIDELHPEAIRAHETARCGLEQDTEKYWTLHRSLFSAPGSHTKDNLEARVREAGLDLAAVQSCLATGRVTDGIRRGGDQASALGAQGTPAFFVGMRDPGSNTVRVLEAIKGAHPYQVFEEALQKALEQAR